METSQDTGGVPNFERIEAYRILIQNTEQLSTRRQAVNGVFVTLNTIFLTAIGVLISTHLDWLNSWSATVALIVIACAITPLNIAWLFSLTRYAKANGVRYTMLQEIEERLPLESGFGLYRRFAQKDIRPNFNTRGDFFIATYFACFYLVACSLAAVLAELIQQGAMSPLKLS